MEPRELPKRLARFVPPIAALTEGIEFVSMWRWAKLSLLVGCATGLAGAGVYALLEWAEATLLYRLAGFDHTGGGDAGRHVPFWWLLVLVPAVGGALSGLVSYLGGSETRGAGTDAVLEAFHHNDGYIRRRVPLVKLVATLFTLGSGGSAGREGPMAQIGAAFGSFLATAMHLSVRERRLLLLAGAAGGISALFRTPLGAALWALEVLYKDDFESDGLFPCLVSSVSAYSIATLLQDQGERFLVPVSYEFHPAQLAFYGALAVLCAPVAVLWIKINVFSEQRIWRPMPLPTWLKPALGGLLLGLLCLVVPWVFSSGYVWMQDALRQNADPMRQLPIGYAGAALLFGLALAKMVATSLTVCSGGSGGIFAPSLFIGGFIGGSVGLLCHELFPDVVTEPGAFVLVGMGAFYAGIAKVPISTIVLISELFGSYDLLVPLMFTEMISGLLLRRYSLYDAQVDRAIDSPAHEADFTVDVLKDLRVGDHFTEGRASAMVAASMTLADFLEHVSREADSFFVVHDRQGKPTGIVSLSNVRSVVNETEFLGMMLVSDAMWPLHTVAPELNLQEALDLFLTTGYDHLPVVDPARPGIILGMLSQQQVFAAYNGEILRRRIGDDRFDGETTAG